MIELHMPNFTILTRDGLEHMGDCSIMNEVMLRDVYGFHILKEFLGEPEIIMDIGGHIGCWGMMAKRLWPNARLIAFEPHPVSHDMYVKNLTLNGMNTAVVNNMAVTSDKSKSFLAIGNTAGTGGFWLVNPEDLPEINKPDSALRQYTNEEFFLHMDGVQTVTLEEVFENYELEKVDILKLDCEGSEIGIIKDMPDSIALKIKFIMGEYHCEGGWNRFHGLMESKFKHLIPAAVHGPQTFIGEFIAADESIIRGLQEKGRG